MIATPNTSRAQNPEEEPSPLFIALQTLLDPSLTAEAMAKEMLTTPNQLAEWSDLPKLTQLMETLEKIYQTRARLMAAEALPAAINLLIHLVRESDLTSVQSREVARRAAMAIIRLSKPQKPSGTGLQPVPSHPTPPAPTSPSSPPPTPRGTDVPPVPSSPTSPASPSHLTSTNELVERSAQHCTHIPPVPNTPTPHSSPSHPSDQSHQPNPLIHSHTPLAPRHTHITDLAPHSSTTRPLSPSPPSPSHNSPTTHPPPTARQSRAA